MGWERGRYYTKSRKVNGRVVREYVGAGRVAELAAQLDALDRDQRESDADARRAVRAELDALAEKLSDLNERCELLIRATLVLAGYHQHKRGEWRKRRVRKESTWPGPEADVQPFRERRNDQNLK
jgi:hypothetical protein